MSAIMGILNVTPDSFSGDGLAASPAQALARLEAMIREGADVIDIGAQSTRPGACLVAPEEECARLAPIFAALPGFQGQARFSIDSFNAATVARAAEAGCRMLNLVLPERETIDPALLDIARAFRMDIILTHALSVPADASVTLPPESDPVAHLLAWGEKMKRQFLDQGVPPERLILDPGIGFGKTATQSLALLREVARLKALGVKLMIGHSRKSFLKSFCSDEAAKGRDQATLIFSCHLSAQGVDYLRVHDVASHVVMRAIAEALVR
jgi:dihydropteroate synthase